MAQVRGYENDIFISYTHVDNEPVFKGEDGWITNFHRSLEVRLHQLLGEEVVIWRDPKLKGHDYLSDTIEAQFPATVLLVCVLSPRYIKSEWCMREIDAFVRAAESTGGLKIDNKSRLFKVVKTPVVRDKQPTELQGLIGYDFYEIEQETGKPREFRQDIGANKDLRYTAKFEDLALEIYQFLEQIKQPRVTDAPPDSAKKKSIYLAETTSDLNLQRDRIKRELEQFGYRTFPDIQLPLDTTVLDTVIRSYLKNSRLSVHMVGSNYGIIPEADPKGRSMARIQYDIAGELCDNGHFCRILWLPPGLRPKETKQEEFVKYLQQDPEGLKGAEFLQAPIEKLKTLIQEKLRNGRSNGHQKAKAPGSANGSLSVYLIHNQDDAQAIEPVKEHLINQGYEITVPFFDGDESELREDHQDNLVVCDAVLIYQGKASALWQRGKQRDLKKAAGWGRQSRFLAKAIYLAAPETDHKTEFQTGEARVIQDYGKFNPDILAEFIADLEKVKAE